MIKLIIFDWDDVFTKGSTEGYLKCYHEAVSGVGVNLTPEEELERIKARWGAPHREELAELLKEKPELIEAAAVLYEQHLFGSTFTDCLSIVPGSAELLIKLSNKYTLALATGVHPRILKDKVMPKFKIQPNLFAQIITAYDLDDPAHSKPHPHIAQKIMKDQNVEPENTVMFGDAKNDVLMAQKAGIEPIVVLTGYLDKRQAEELGVSYIIDDVAKLEPVLTML